MMFSLNGDFNTAAACIVAAVVADALSLDSECQPLTQFPPYLISIPILNPNLPSHTKYHVLIISTNLHTSIPPFPHFHHSIFANNYLQNIQTPSSTPTLLLILAHLKNPPTHPYPLLTPFIQPTSAYYLHISIAFQIQLSTALPTNIT